ncbi:MAG: hypothetical protein MUF45_00035 [Spirosomaceae bacterium]|jgi:hypothetical protein|nr:hypothetical protein [Spirosomataceae bacterium]
MKIYSYVIVRDYGFAPNPFNGLCTLATCKADIRQNANVGDWIIGTGGKDIAGSDGDFEGKLVYAMRVDEKLTYNQYWEDSRFELKKPVINGSLVQMYGDNIYHKENDIWIQQNSHHSNEDGSPNSVNIARDTKSSFVLVSENFYYFGRLARKLPEQLHESFLKKGQGYKTITNFEEINSFLDWLSKFEMGIHADPISFNENFERYSYNE